MHGLVMFGVGFLVDVQSEIRFHRFALLALKLSTSLDRLEPTGQVRTTSWTHAGRYITTQALLVLLLEWRFPPAPGFSWEKRRAFSGRLGGIQQKNMKHPPQSNARY